jgi:MFS transporter, DHA1 family, multidrug resistance protein
MKSSHHHVALGFREFVLLMAALMALNSFAIDSMLPALPQIAHDLHVTDANRRQLVISIYVLGFGAAQLFYGTLSDRFGRKPVLLIGMLGYVICSLVAAVAGSFILLLAVRVLQGIAAASSRVIAVSIVRDRYDGRQMARVMSLVTMVFIIVPVIAPSIGQLITLFGSWRLIFASLSVAAAVVVLWAIVRLPETLAPENRMAITPASVGHAVKQVVSNRLSIGYTLAQTLMYGAMMGYLNSSQQIFSETFDSPRMFPLLFAVVSIAIAASSYCNSRLVERLGMRLLSHSALLGYFIVALTHMLLSHFGHETLVSFLVMQTLTTAMFSLASSNFNAMAMENMGAIAGTAASVQGCVSTSGAALLGMVIGLHLDGTTRPLAIGTFCYGTLALLCVLWTERGRLFQRHHLVPLVPADEVDLEAPSFPRS